MKRYCTLELDVINTIHELKKLGIEEAKVNGYLITVNSDRYDNFYTHGFKCACCGLEATFAAVEKDSKAKNYHINFYGTRADGREICFTKDHIFPRCKGGFDSVENYQVLCASCNGRKGNKTSLTVDQAVKLGYTSYERANICKQIEEEKQLILRLNNLMQKRRAQVARLTQRANELIPPREKLEFI